MCAVRSEPTVGFSVGKVASQNMFVGAQTFFFFGLRFDIIPDLQST